MTKELKIHDFQQYYNNSFYFYDFKHKGKAYQICIEPTVEGFDVALYEKEDQYYNAIFPKESTNHEYHNDAFCVRARRPETWAKAVKIANLLLLKLKTS